MNTTFESAAPAPRGLPPGAMMRPLAQTPGLPAGARLRPLKPHAEKPEKLTHPAGKVTAIDEETGLPIVRRDAAHSPKIESDGKNEAEKLRKQDQPNAEVAAEPRKTGANHSDFIQEVDVPRGTSGDREVVQGSHDPTEIRQSAQEQEPTLRAMARSAAAEVPGAKLEGSRVKAADSQANKELRGKPAATNIDNLGARLSAPSRAALERLKAHIVKKLPVEGHAKIDSNGLNVDQFTVRTGGKDAANQVSELQVASPEQFAAMKRTEPLYEQQKAALARGDKDEAARLEAQITAEHSKTSKNVEKPEKEHKFKFGSTQADVPKDSEAGTALAAARGKIDPKDLMADGLEEEPHVTVRYGIKGEDTSPLRKFIAAQKPFTVTLGKTASFKPSEHSDGAAPVIVPVDSPELRQLEAAMDKHGDFAERSFPDYKPHVTLAYVNPESARKYEGSSATEGKKFLVTAIAITDRDGKKETVKLGNQQTAPLKAGDVVAFKDGRAGVVQFSTGRRELERLRVRTAGGQMLNSVRPGDVNKVTAPPVDPESQWYGSDLDGTLAEYHTFEGLDKIGKPVGTDDPDSALNTVKRWIAEGKDVRILSARISHDEKGDGKAAIEAWTQQYLGKALPVTEKKDAKMVKLLDDRAVQVEENTGRLMGGREALREAGDAHRQSERQEATQ